MVTAERGGEIYLVIDKTPWTDSSDESCVIVTSAAKLCEINVLNWTNNDSTSSGYREMIKSSRTASKWAWRWDRQVKVRNKLGLFFTFVFVFIDLPCGQKQLREKQIKRRQALFFFLLIDSFSFLPPPTLHPPTHPSTELEMSIDLSKYEVLSIRTTTSPNFSFFFPSRPKTEVLKLQEKAKTCCIVCKTVIWKAVNRIS